MRRSAAPSSAVITAIVICLLTLTAVPTAASAVRQGSRAPVVTIIQYVLTQHGFPVRIDGVFGAETKAAVQAFQRQAGLSADGVVGAKTWQALAKGIYPKALGSGGPPSPYVYTVVKGDTLTSIAAEFGSSVSELMRVNALKNSRLSIGQKIKIPVPAVATTVSGPRPAFIWPVEGPITSPFGYRTHPVYGTEDFHGGIDIGVPEGSAVRAVAAGTVRQAEDMGAFGLGVVIDHGYGITSWYGHNASVAVEAGQRVQQGDVIAAAGSTGVATGPHVDLRIKVGNEVVNPQDWLP